VPNHPLHFLVEFVRRPQSVGAISPSSSHLGREIASHVGIEDAESVVELGPGTGGLTRAILAALPGKATFLAIDNNPTMASLFRSAFPDVNLVEESVEKLADIAKEHGMGQVDCILSGLPWANFDDGLQNRILEQIVTVLRPGGWFATFAYLQGTMLPRGRAFRCKLGDRFATVTRSAVVWRNVPPAFVYRCRR